MRRRRRRRGFGSALEGGAKPILESPVQIGVDRQIRREQMHVDILELVHLLNGVPLVIPEPGRGHEQGEAEPADGARSARRAAIPCGNAGRGGLALGNPLGDSGERRGARLLQAIDGAGGEVGYAAVEVAGHLPREFGFWVGHSVIPLALSISAKARTAREQCVFTLPSEQPIAAAVSATSSSS